MFQEKKKTSTARLSKASYSLQEILNRNQNLEIYANQISSFGLKGKSSSGSLSKGLIPGGLKRPHRSMI